MDRKAHFLYFALSIKVSYEPMNENTSYSLHRKYVGETRPTRCVDGQKIHAWKEKGNYIHFETPTKTNEIECPWVVWNWGWHRVRLNEWPAREWWWVCLVRVKPHAQSFCNMFVAFVISSPTWHIPITSRFSITKHKSTMVLFFGNYPTWFELGTKQAPMGWVGYEFRLTHAQSYYMLFRHHFVGMFIYSFGAKHKRMCLVATIWPFHKLSMLYF